MVVVIIGVVVGRLEEMVEKVDPEDEKETHLKSKDSYWKDKPLTCRVCKKGV